MEYTSKPTRLIWCLVCSVSTPFFMPEKQCGCLGELVLNRAIQDKLLSWKVTVDWDSQITWLSLAYKYWSRWVSDQGRREAVTDRGVLQNPLSRYFTALLSVPSFTNWIVTEHVSFNIPCRWNGHCLWTNVKIRTDSERFSCWWGGVSANIPNSCPLLLFLLRSLDWMWANYTTRNNCGADTLTHHHLYSKSAFLYVQERNTEILALTWRMIESECLLNHTGNILCALMWAWSRRSVQFSLPCTLISASSPPSWPYECLLWRELIKFNKSYSPKNIQSAAGVQ